MNYEAVEFWFSAGQWVFSLILAGSIWFNRKQAATVQRVERVESRLGKRVEDVEKEKKTWSRSRQSCGISQASRAWRN